MRIKGDAVAETARNDKFRNNEIIIEDDRTSLTVGVIIKGHKTDHRHCLWTT